MPRIVESEDVRKWNKLREAARHARLPYERDWWLNVAFTYDEQYSEWSNEIQNVRRIKRDRLPDGTEDRKPRPVANKIKHFAQQQHAFMKQLRPIPEVEPTNEDIIAQSDAEVALGYCVWASTPGVTDFERTLSRAHWWAIVAGTSFMKWTWDSNKKQPQITYVDPFSLFIDPFAEDWNQVRWVIHSKYMDKEGVYDAYGRELKGKGEKQDATRAALLREMGNAPAVEGYTVNEIWMKPSRRKPGGLFGAWCGQETLIEAGDIPYDELRDAGKLPFTPMGVVPGLNTPYYGSDVKTMRPLQMELNKTHAQELMMGDNFAGLWWWIPQEAELEQGKMSPSAARDQVLRGTGAEGIKPEIIAPPAMPQTDRKDWIAAEMKDAVGIHDVSSGQVQGRLESAKAIEEVKEGDATRLSELADSTAWAIAEGFTQLTWLAKQYETEKKMVTVFSAEGIPQVREFKAREADPGIQYRVSMGNGLGHTKAGRQEALYNLWDRGILQEDPVRMLKLLDVGGPLPLTSDARDTMLARNENFDMARGTAVVPNSWDNHPIHIKEHNDFRKTNAFKLLGNREKALFEFQVRTHEALFLRELEKQAMQQLVGQGATVQASAQDAAQADSAESEAGATTDAQAGSPTEPAAEPAG